MNKHDYIIEVRQEIFRLVHQGNVQRFTDTEASIEYCFDSEMSVNQAVKTFF